MTENFSPTTLADKTMKHQPLIISGSPNFKQSALHVALDFNLDISFADKLMQNEFVRRKSIIQNERQNFISNVGILISKRPFSTKFFPPDLSKTVEDAKKVVLNLPFISDLQAIPQSENDISLSEEEKVELEQLARYSYKNLRFDFSDERKKFAKWTAGKILQRFDKSFDYISAHSHVEYINRENAFAHHLPKWAKDDPKIFFKAADRYEGKGNRRYVEIEFALPNELQVSLNAKHLFESQLFLNSNPDSLQDFKSKLFSSIEDVNKWKRAIISRKDAETQARMEYMTEAERDVWRSYFETLAQKKHLEEFLTSLKQPNVSQNNALQAYNDIVSGVKKKFLPSSLLPLS